MARVLIIEDKSDLADLLATHLRTAGHDVLTVPDAGRALPALETFAPDLVLLDLLLPDAVGLNVCEFMRSAPEHASTPIVVLSACQQSETRRLAVQAGVDDYISKPFDLEDVIVRIETQLVIANHFRRRSSRRVSLGA